MYCRCMKEMDELKMRDGDACGKYKRERIPIRVEIGGGVKDEYVCK